MMRSGVTDKAKIRGHQVNLRVTTAELKQIDKAAEADHLPRGTWIRRMILKAVAALKGDK